MTLRSSTRGNRPSGQDIASTSFSTPAHKNDFGLFLLLPLTVTQEEIGVYVPFCIDIASEFYVQDASGEPRQTRWRIFDDAIDGISENERKPGNSCSRYFEVYDIDGGDGSDEGEGNSSSSSDDDNDDDDGKNDDGSSSSDSHDDDDYLDSSTDSTPSPPQSPPPSSPPSPLDPPNP